MFIKCWEAFWRAIQEKYLLVRTAFPAKNDVQNLPDNENITFITEYWRFGFLGTWWKRNKWPASHLCTVDTAALREQPVFLSYFNEESGINSQSSKDEEEYGFRVLRAIMGLVDLKM